MNRTTKTCGRCNQSKPLSEFYRKPRESGGVTVYCKTCFNTYTTERFRRRKKQAVAYLGGRCIDCGGVFPYHVYDFHHLDPTRKDVQFTVLRRRSWEAITQELDKCVLLCANCHRIRHWAKFDH
jgi:uncharacterized OB-fold protein